MNRTLPILTCLCVAALAFAEADRPKNLERLPDLSPPAVGEPDASVEPQVTITPQRGTTFEGYGPRGLKVTGKSGKSYYLQDESAYGRSYQRNTPSPEIAVPQWNILNFGP